MQHQFKPEDVMQSVSNSRHLAGAADHMVLRRGPMAMWSMTSPRCRECSFSRHRALCSVPGTTRFSLEQALNGAVQSGRLLHKFSGSLHAHLLHQLL